MDLMQLVALAEQESEGNLASGSQPQTTSLPVVFYLSPAVLGAKEPLVVVPYPRGKPGM